MITQNPRARNQYDGSKRDKDNKNRARQTYHCTKIIDPEKDPLLDEAIMVRAAIGLKLEFLPTDPQLLYTTM